MYKGTEFDFNAEYLNAFEELKKRLVQAPILAYYNLERLLRVETNASNKVIASMFLQLGKNEE